MFLELKGMKRILVVFFLNVGKNVFEYNKKKKRCIYIYIYIYSLNCSFQVQTIYD